MKSLASSVTNLKLKYITGLTGLKPKLVPSSPDEGQSVSKINASPSSNDISLSLDNILPGDLSSGTISVCFGRPLFSLSLRLEISAG
jgi:hypothetical protein